MRSHSKTIHRLWLIGIALATFVGTLAIGNAFVSPDQRLTAKMLGHDFLAFYTAGNFLREGRSREIYDLQKVKAYQHELAAREGLEIGQSFGPFWNPPFYAWVFEPLASLSYRQALGAWWGVNGACLAGALALMMLILRGGKGVKHEGVKHEEKMPDSAPSLTRNSQLATHNSSSNSQLATSNCSPSVYLLIPLFLCTAMPFIQALSHGQNTMTSLVILAGVVALWRADRAVWAGLLAGLLLYKPQLGAVIAGALVLTMGWRALVGLSITGIALLAVTDFTLPGVLGDYQRLLPANLYQFQVEQVYLWDRHVTLRAFWRLLIQGRAAGEMMGVAKVCWIASCAAIIAGLAKAWWEMRRAGRASARRDLAKCNPAQHRITRDWFIASVIVAMPLVMPFYFDYDLLLVSISAVLSARAVYSETAVSAKRGSAHRPLFWAWCGLYGWVMINLAVAGLTRINGSVLWLCVIETMLILRTIRSARDAGVRSDAPTTDIRQAPPLAAAA